MTNVKNNLVADKMANQEIEENVLNEVTGGGGWGSDGSHFLSKEEPGSKILSKEGWGSKNLSKDKL